MPDDSPAIGPSVNDRKQPVGEARQKIIEKFAKTIWLRRGGGHSTEAQMLMDWEEAVKRFDELSKFHSD